MSWVDLYSRYFMFILNQELYMIVHNVTIKVDWAIHHEWLLWMKEVTIPDMMSTGFFVEYRMLKLLGVDESDGPTYAVQYSADSMNQYEMFVKSQGDIQYKIESNKWGNKFVSFNTIMEVVY